jgi:hypothetical protein
MSDTIKDKAKKAALTAYKAALTPSVTAGGAALGLGMGAANPAFPGVIPSTKYGAKAAFNSIWGDEEDSKKNHDELIAAKKREDSIERKANKGENTNAAGDSYKKGGTVSSASKRADGCCVKGKTRGKMV